MEARASARRQADNRTPNDGACGQLNRRSFVVGAASAAVVAAVGESTAAAHPADGDLPQVLGEVTSHVSARAIRAIADDGEPVRIVLAPEASVEREGRSAALADFEVGDWFLAIGQPSGDGRFSAARVIPAVLGAKQPPRP